VSDYRLTPNEHFIIYITPERMRKIYLLLN